MVFSAFDLLRCLETQVSPWKYLLSPPVRWTELGAASLLFLCSFLLSFFFSTRAKMSVFTSSSASSSYSVGKSRSFRLPLLEGVGVVSFMIVGSLVLGDSAAAAVVAAVIVASPTAAAVAAEVVAAGAVSAAATLAAAAATLATAFSLLLLLSLLPLPLLLTYCCCSYYCCSSSCCCSCCYY